MNGEMDLRIVSPYRPFAPESKCHRTIGPFDWVGALQMLSLSVDRAMGCETLAITDVDTDLPMPSLQFATTERRLMLWILEVALCYVRSTHFDRDTIMLSPDLLVFRDLRRWMTDRVVFLMRSRFPKHPLLNGVQFWPLVQKDRLIAFYEQALAIGRTLDEHWIRWGGDTEPLRRLLAPLAFGHVTRSGVSIRMVEADDILEAVSPGRMRSTAWPSKSIVDFRYIRKRQMRAYFTATLGRLVAA